MEFWDKLLFAEGNDLDALFSALRAVIIFGTALIMVRIGKKRFLGKNNAFDFVFAIILGSVFSRVINGSAALIPTLTAAVVLILLHMTLSFLITRIKWLAHYFEGEPDQLVKGGKILIDRVKYHNLREEDILEAARRDGVFNLDEVHNSYLETNGQISIQKKEEKRG